MRSRKRKRIKKLVRQARDRSSPGEPVLRGIPIEVFSCSCGNLLQIPLSVGLLHQSCAGCGRRFSVSITRAGDGQFVFDATFLDDQAMNSTTRFVIPPRKATPDPAEDLSATEPGIPTEPASGRRGRWSKGLLDDAVEPEPPPRLRFECPCGHGQAVEKPEYDTRKKCARCGVLLLINVFYDVESRSHKVVPLRILG